MSRVLRRPMFRMGGSANSKGTGITSGLDRKEYADAGFVDPTQLGQKMSDLQQLQEQFGIAYKRPQRAPAFGTPEFLRLAQLGLGIAGAPGGRSIAEVLAEQGVPFLGDIATSMEKKKLREEQLDEAERAAKAGVFETAYKDIQAAGELEKKIQAEKDIQAEKYDLEEKLRKSLGEDEMDRLIKEYDLKGELEKMKLGDEKSYALGYKLDQLEKNIKVISEVDKALESTDLDPNERQQLELKKNIAERKLKELEELDPVVQSFLDSDIGQMYYVQIGSALEETVNPATGEFWKKTDPGYYQKVFQMAKEELGAGYASGGRVGYQTGGEVGMSAVAQPTTAATQEEVNSMGYDELRARLPREINDEIVRLLSMSPQALSDFAQIQTQSDVDTFNRKYGVTLALPQEA